jgi:hypothetical protein
MTSTGLGTFFSCFFEKVWYGLGLPLYHHLQHLAG